MDSIKNRLFKNRDKIQKWAKKHNIEAYRIYDRDLPDFPFILDFYKNFYVIYDKSSAYIERDELHFKIFENVVKENFSPNNKIFIKSRKRQEGLSQYEKLNNEKFELTIFEGKAQFLVNLSDYLDTGLFLDHRTLRYQIFKNSKNKSVLNLFCYTGAFSVLAALGGGRTTSIDMSKNYMDWCRKNFEINNLDLNQHQFICDDIFRAIPLVSTKYDIIILDPPTFSNSKKMIQDFEVEKDQIFLITECMKRLKSDGILYFSNNKRKFKLDKSIELLFSVKNISLETIPLDFHDQKIHHCFEIKHLKSNKDV